MLYLTTQPAGMKLLWSLSMTLPLSAMRKRGGEPAARL